MTLEVDIAVAKPGLLSKLNIIANDIELNLNGRLAGSIKYYRVKIMIMTNDGESSVYQDKLMILFVHMISHPYIIQGAPTFIQYNTMSIEFLFLCFFDASYTKDFNLLSFFAWLILL